MIEIENTKIYGWDAAIRGMRNPLNSWNKSDSFCTSNNCEDQFKIGKNDLDLMKKLAKAGTDHSKFMRMITVTCDITAPIYYYKELDTYKVGTVRNSCSTMHKIHDKPFTIDNFSHEHLTPNGMAMLNIIINHLNLEREMLVGTENKEHWWQLIQLLPSSYNQRSTVQLNYQVLRNMYHSRKNHKLDEWHTFCRWIKSLPYSELITGKESITNE